MNNGRVDFKQLGMGKALSQPQEKQNAMSCWRSSYISI